MINPTGEQRRQRLLKYSASLLVAALLSYATLLIAQSWRETQSDQTGQLATIADLSANALDIYFSQLEIGMSNLGAELGEKPSDLARAYARVKRFQDMHTELGNVMLMRGDGQILLTGKTPNLPNLLTLAHDPSFLKFRAELQRRPFVLGQPVLGYIDKSWVSSARYAVTDRAGRLLFILSANLPSNLLQRYRVDSASITALGLVRDDGYLVSRYPEPDVASQDRLYGQPVEMTVGKELRVMRRLPHYPVTLFVEMPMAQVKAAWWEAMHAPYVVMALLLSCTFAFYAVSRHRRRIWSKAQRREELRRNYEEALLERSPNEIMMFDTNTLQVTFANDAALENLGYTLEQLKQKTLLALHPESSIESFGAMIEPLRRGDQEAIKYQTVQARADGSRYPVEVNLQLMVSEEGGVDSSRSSTTSAQSGSSRKISAPLTRPSSVAHPSARWVSPVIFRLLVNHNAGIFN